MTQPKSPGKKYATETAAIWQPGSRNKVLKNKLGIVRLRDMQDAELVAYKNAEQILISTFSDAHQFRSRDIEFIHKTFLGDIYDWAGKTRSVNISKGGFDFASAHAIPSVMHDFEENILAKYTPCTSGPLEEVASAIATVHVELLLIHPFREGNGRTARLLATLMAYQAGFSDIDFSFIKEKGKAYYTYIGAVHDGMDRNYSRMTKVVLKALSGASRVK